MVRALGFIWPAGHSPAAAADMVAGDPAIAAISARPHAVCFDIRVSSSMNRVAIGRTGLSSTIVEIIRGRKCRLALGSIARRYAFSASRKHVLGVGGECR